MTKPIYIIYKHTCIITGKSYIGQTSQTIQKRWKEHRYSTRQKSPFHFHRAIRKYGSNNWIHEIIFSTHNKNILNTSEKFLIAYYNTLNNGYNMTSGGDGFSSGEDHPLFGLFGKNNPNHGSKRTYIQRKNMSGENNPMYNKTHSQESKDKISKKGIGRKHSYKTKLKMSHCQIGKNNNLFKGYYITPWGKFESRYDVTNTLINNTTVARWCKNPHKIIKKSQYNEIKISSVIKRIAIGENF